VVKFLLTAAFRGDIERRISGFINLLIAFAALAVVFSPYIFVCCGLDASLSETKLEDVDLFCSETPRRLVWNHGRYSRHYYVRKKALLRKLKNPPLRRKLSERKYYQDKHKKQAAQQDHREAVKNQQMDHWDGVAPDEEVIFSKTHEWLHLESSMLGLDKLFGSFGTLLDRLDCWKSGDPIDPGPDPLRQFNAIKEINRTSFIESGIGRKHTKWKSRDHARLALVAAAKFSETEDLTSLDLSNLDNREFTKQ
jgi:hypothetical protein